MNHLDYSVSLRVKGFSKNEIKQKLFEKGLDEAQVDYYLKKSDEIFLNGTHSNTKKDHSKTNTYILKIIILALSLFLLCLIFFGYLRVGLIWLLLLWIIISFSALRR